MNVLTAGFLIGMRHALDGDHLAALSVLIVEKPSIRRAAKQGALWGMGHSLTLFLMGVAVIVLDLQLSVQLASVLELLVGVMLIGLGAGLLRRFNQPEPRATPHQVLGIGIMHGLAGSSALILLTLSNIQTTSLALGYIGLFGLGSILGMVLVSVALAWPLHRVSDKANWIPLLTRGSACVLSIGLGVVLIHEAMTTL